MGMDENPNAFKHALDRAAVKRIATLLEGVEPRFERSRFVRRANEGLEGLELKARVSHIIAALKDALPTDPQEAVAAVVEAGRIWRADPASERFVFAAWPLVDFVGAHGLDDFDGSMDALRELTSLFSAEFAIRAFIVADDERALALLKGWTEDPSEHVRRLVSEGTRPRLPWGVRLKRFVEDPTRGLELLEALRDDPSEYVRRSVANHLNDVTKDHPERALDVCERWAHGASPERMGIVKHAARGLVKAGHPRALALLGFDPAAEIELHDFQLDRTRIKVGDKLGFRFELRSVSSKVESLVVDYAVHHVKKNGQRSAKVFKLGTRVLEPHQTVQVEKRHSFAKVTTRVYYPGRHAIEVLVNGRSLGVAELDLAV